MKLAFSTLGCPDFDWPDIYSMAKDFGFSGIELRGLGDDIFSIKAKPFREDNLPKTIEELHKKRLEIPCLSSGCALRFADRAEQTHRELLDYIDLASKLGASYIRVLGDLTAEPRGEVDDAVVVKALKALAPYAEEKGVTLLVETNGVYTDTQRLRELLDTVQSDNVAALW
ncbi:sugar phosphate isomerase/epimerase family protein, partial [Ligaoa zhengdingensis]